MGEDFEDRRTRQCGTMEAHRHLLDIDPEYREKRLDIERYTRWYVQNRAEAGAGLRSGIVIIPVVVHVVYKDTAQNISDAQINSQIAVLNQDYRKLNTDVSNVPSVFQSVVADCRIQFQLAVRDPQCQATTGITRTQTTETFFYAHNDGVKSATSGGHDPWPRDKYLNIWVCHDLRKSNGDPLMGYARFPGCSADVDGVAIVHRYFGNTGTAASPFDLGRTATHEIGHWFNLLHIWGDDGGLCSGSDEVADTPNQSSENYDCPTFPHVSCSNGPNGDMFMNYMDYVDDDCMVMFTAGQSARMDATLYGERSAIVASDALIPPPERTQDLWSKDMADDLGAEPNTISSHMYLSDDIWVRRQNDGIADQEHQNPEFRPASGDPNYVYVRVRNLGCGSAASGTLRLYWAKASSALGWPAPWDGSVTAPALMGGYIGDKPTGNVPAAGSVILEFPWHPPNPGDYAMFGGDRSHFCLLSRIETASSSPYGMTFAEGSNLGTNVRNNNNIVWKNIQVVDEEEEGGRVGYATVGGLLEEMVLARLVFSVPKGEASIFDWGRVTVRLSEELFEIWQAGGGEGEAIEVIDDFTIMLLEPNAWLGMFELPPQELFSFRIHVEPFKERGEGTHIFFLDLAQHAVEWDDMVVGGMRFTIKTAGEPRYSLGTKPWLRFDGRIWVP